MEKEVFDEFRPLREAKISEWRAKGFSEQMINAAIDRATDWVQGLSEKLIGSKPGIISRYPEILAEVQRANYAEALDDSEKYLEEFYEAFVSKKSEILKEVI